MQDMLCSKKIYDGYMLVNTPHVSAVGVSLNLFVVTFCVNATKLQYKKHAGMC